MSDRHTACCIKLQYYALPTSPCTCPPGAGLDPDGEYVIDWTGGSPRIVEAQDSDPDEAVMTLSDASFEVQEWQDAQWKTTVAQPANP
jgi:hypothetical protein